MRVGASVSAAGHRGLGNIRTWVGGPAAAALLPRWVDTLGLKASRRLFQDTTANFSCSAFVIVDRAIGETTDAEP